MPVRVRTCQSPVAGRGGWFHAGRGGWFRTRIRGAMRSISSCCLPSCSSPFGGLMKASCAVSSSWAKMSGTKGIMCFSHRSCPAGAPSGLRFTTFTSCGLMCVSSDWMTCTTSATSQLRASKLGEHFLLADKECLIAVRNASYSKAELCRDARLGLSSRLTCSLHKNLHRRWYKSLHLPQCQQRFCCWLCRSSSPAGPLQTAAQLCVLPGLLQL